MEAISSRFASVLVVALASPLVAQGFLHAPVAVLPADSVPFQRLFDADGDGDLDAVGTRVSGGGYVEMRVFRNDGGRFTPAFTTTAQATLPGQVFVARVATGDLDGDGDEDFVAGAGQEVFVMTNNGNMQFGLTVHPINGTVRDTAIGDFDGDGIGDLATFYVAGSFGGLEVMTGNTIRSTIVTNSTQADHRILVLDIDGDPAQEIAVTRFRQATLVDVTPTALVVTGLSDSSIGSATHWTAGDIDKDGDTDLVVFESVTSSQQVPTVHVFRRIGPATWSLEPSYPGGFAEYLADIDGDGDLDGVCCGGGSGGGGGIGTWPQLDFGSTFEIAINRGGVFQPAFEFPGFGSRSLAGVADIDGDGDVDLVAGACVFYGQGPFDENPMPMDGGFFSARRYPDQAIDQDRDGDPDVASLPNRPARNRGDGTFVGTLPDQQLPAGTILGGCSFIGDFDGDGAADEVWPLFSSTSPNPFVSMGLWRNNGSGVLTYVGSPTAPGVRMGIGWQPEQSDVADLDDDGDLDAIANSDPRYEQRHTEVFWNDGAAHFTPGPTVVGERFEGAADFDGDGRIDVLMSVGAAGELRLRLGSGNPGAPFGAPLALFAGTTLGTLCKSVTLVDANGDGRTDVLAVTGSGDMHLWRNMTAAPGAPQFDIVAGGFLPLASVIGWSLTRIEVLDVDGDGRQDLVAGPLTQTEKIAVYIRLPGAGSSLDASSYAPPVVQITPMGFARDVDGDGDVDLMGPRIVRNLTRHGPTSSLRRQYGTPTPGEAGVVPLLGATGSLRAGGQKTLLVRGITGPTTLALGISLQEANLPSVPLPGITCLIDPNPLLIAFLSVTENSGGRAAAGLEIPFPIPPGIGGLDAYEQVVVFDPAGPSGAAASNGLHIRVGF